MSYNTVYVAAQVLNFPSTEKTSQERDRLSMLFFGSTCAKFFFYKIIIMYAPVMIAAL